MKTKTFHRIFAVILSVAMLFSGIGYGGLKSVNAADLLTIKFVNGKLYEVEVTETEAGETVRTPVLATSVYTGNTISNMTLGNATGATQDLYMDGGTMVEFDIVDDVNSSGFKAFISDAAGAPLEQPYTTVVSTVGGTASTEDKMFSFTIDKGKLSIFPDNQKTSDIKNYYIYFSEVNGGYSYILNIHVMTKTQMGLFSIHGSRPSIRSGKNVDMNIITTPGNPEAYLGTDGYKWSVENIGDSVGHDLLGSVVPTGEGSTLFMKENSAKFSSDSTKGSGVVRVTATTDSGIISEDDGNIKCIALLSREEKSTFEIIITPHYPAEIVSFTSDNYEMMVGTSIPLRSLITSSQQTYINPQGEYFDPTDDFIFTIPVSQHRFASISEMDGVQYIDIHSSGTVKLTCTAENPDVTAECTINTYNKTQLIEVSSNDEILANTEGISRNCSVRSGNTLTFNVRESEGADEDLVWSDNAYSFFDIRLDSDTGSEKTYVFTADPNRIVTTPQTVNINISTDRPSYNGEYVGNIMANYRIIIYPAYSDDVDLNTSAIIIDTLSSSSDDEVLFDSLDLYQHEKAIVKAAPEGAVAGEPDDQITWSVTENSSLITLEEYKTLSSTTAYTSATITKNNVDYYGVAKVSAKAASNENVFKDFNVNTRRRIDNVRLSIGGNYNPTLSKGGEADIVAEVSPVDNEEYLEYESEAEGIVEVNKDTGHIKALNKTDSDGVNINVYACHDHTGIDIRTGETVTTVHRVKKATINIRVNEIGNVEIDPVSDTVVYNGASANFTATAYDMSSGIATPQNNVVFNWSSGNEKVATVNDTHDKSVIATSVKVGTTTISAEVDGSDGVGESFLTVTAPLNDPNISFDDLNVSDIRSDNSYIYLPNGISQNIEPKLIADGIDSREDDNNKYTLQKNIDYTMEDSFEDGKGIGLYSIVFAPGSNGLYTGEVSKPYTIFPKSLGDGTNIDADISVQQIGELTYNGEPQNPVLSISYTKRGETENLELNKDYMIIPAEGDSLINAGTHKVIIIGTGNFSEVVDFPSAFEFEYEIKPYDIEDTFGLGTKLYDLKNNKFVDDDAIEDQTYTAKAITPSVERLVYAYIRGTELDPIALSYDPNDAMTDFEYSYSNNVNAYSNDNPDFGTATVTIVGKNNYTGTIRTTFKILRKDISSDIYVEPIPNKIFTGYKIQPEISAYYGSSAEFSSEELESGKDYEVSYLDNVDSQVVSGKSASVIISGKGNYTGSRTQPFTIEQADLSDSETVIISDIPDQYDCGTFLRPPVSVRYGGYTLIEGEDFTPFYGRDNGTNLEYNYSVGENKGVVAIIPVEIGNFRASRPTTICGRFGQEKFFNIVDKTITHKADSISIKRIVSDPNESTDLLKPNTIFVNAVGGVTVNTTVQFDIEAICSTGDCDDPIFVTIPDENIGKFNCSVETLDFVQGNKAVLTVTGGPGAATGKIYLATKSGYNMAVTVVVNDPATDVQLVYDTNKTDMRNHVISNISNGVTSVREKHDFYLIANLSRGNRDEVNWESDNESVATVDVTGKVTAHGQGKATISATTKASELFDGGVKGYITMNVFGNVMAETLSIEPEISQIRTGRIMQLNGFAVGENGSDVTENLVWKSDNENIVKIIDGRETSAVTIEAKSPGTTTLHYGSEFENGNEATLQITVYNPDISVSIREWFSNDADDIGLINGVVNVPRNVYGVVVEKQDESYVLKDDAKVEWTPGNEDILTVEYNNENHTSVNLLFHKVGTTTLTVESGGETALYNVTVTAPLNGANGPDDPYVSVSDVEDCTYLPNGLVPTFEEKAISSVDSRGAQYKLEKAKDYVISNNYPKGGAVGNYVYTLSKAVNGLYTDSLDIPYSVLAKSIGVGDEPDAEITVEQKDSLTYNASPQIPDLKISYTVGDETEVLAKNAYQIDPYYDGYSMDNLTSAGQHKVLVSGLGNYTGSFVYEYTIAPYNIQEIGKNSILRKDGSYVTKDAIPDQTYTAKEITPSVDWLLFAFINGSNSEPVVMNYNPDSSITDFEYSYSDNVNAYSEDNSRFGTATITFVGKNNYTGTVSTTFKIVKKDISTEIYIPEIPVQAYTGFEIKPEVSAYYGSSDTYYNEKLESGTDFDVSFRDNILSTDVSGKNATVTITGKKNYTGTTTRQFVIGQADLSDPDVVTIDSIPDQYDCGTLLTPPITVRMGEYTLVKDVDYLVSYGNGIDKKYNVSQGTNAGVVTITPVPGGNFTAVKNITTVRGVMGQEAFFNIVTNSAAVKADAITITQENGDALINGKIYVNKEKNGFSDNTTLKFKIKSVMNDGSESNDAVYATADNGTERYFDYSVRNLNSDTSGNEAEVTITGKEAGTAQIKLRTKKGTAKNVDVIILEPASDIKIFKDGSDVSDGDQYMLRENHDYNLEAVFDSGSVTDTVTWSVDDESIAVINEEGKLTTLTTGSIRVFAETNPSLLYPGGIKAVANFNIEENNLAENVVIRNGYDVISKLDLQLDGTITLTGVATRTFGEVTEQLEWTSSDENVISIIDGRTTGTATIKAVGPGTATISYGSKLDENEGGVRASCEVSVLVPVTQVGLSSNSLTVEQGGSVDLKATFNEYAADEFIWTSSNPEAVTISGTSTEIANSQTVTLNGLKAGAESTITVVSRTNPSALATCKVQVVDKNAEYVDIEAINATILNGEITIKTGDYLSLKGISSNSSGTISEALKWKSSNNGILRIIGSDSSSEVKLNALSSGTVTVTYGSTKEGGVTASVTVHIVDSVMYINVDKTEVNLSEGEKTTITASFNDKATGQFDWKADDTSVVKIEGASGNNTNSETVTVTGLTPGKQTKITVSSKDDANISETIIVKIAENMAESVTLDKTSAEVIKGDTLTLKGTATRSKGVITEALEWKTSNPNVIKITSGQGTDTAVFTAVAAGEATITYGSKISGGKIAECKVTVKNAESSTQSGTEDKPSGGDDKPSGGNDDSSADEGKVGSTKTIGDNTYTVKSENELVFTSVSDSATKVVIPAEVTINGKSYKVTEIAKNAFAGNSKLKSVTIGSNVETIGDNAFKNCKSLTKIVIPAKVKTIGKNAFAGCKKLKTITIKSKKLTKIGKKAFKTIKKGATFKCPKAKKSKYKKLLKKSGLPKKAKVK